MLSPSFAPVQQKSGSECHIFFTANFTRKGSNPPRKVRYELSRGANCHLKDRSKLLRTVKYHSKDRAGPNNRCRENAANYCDLSRKYRVERKFFEKLRKARNFDEVRLHYFCTILYRKTHQKNFEGVALFMCWLWESEQNVVVSRY